MEFPNSITLVRHAQSEYNILREQKESDSEYQEFQREYEADMTSPKTRALAQKMKDKLATGVGDYQTSLTEEGVRQAKMVGEMLRQQIPCPDFIFVSPHFRTRETLGLMSSVWPELQRTPTIIEELVCEQSYGIGVLYNDWRVFQTFHPEQKEYRELATPYFYKHPQGESIHDVRLRAKLFKIEYAEMCAGKNILIVSHHRAILSFVANEQGMSPEEFMQTDKEQPPINCGVTSFRKIMHLDDKLELEYYNKKLWT